MWLNQLQYIFYVILIGIIGNHQLIEGSVLLKTLGVQPFPTSNQTIFQHNVHATTSTNKPSNSYIFYQPVVNKLTREFMTKRNEKTFPFLSLEFYLSLCTIVLDKPMRNPYNIFNMINAHKASGQKPIIFLPSEYLLWYYEVIQAIEIPFSLITISKHPFCHPFISYPSTCTHEVNIVQEQNFCQRMNTLLHHVSLQLWYMTNPCIVHDKIHPIPMGLQWMELTSAQEVHSKQYYTTDVEATMAVLKPYAHLADLYFVNNTKAINEAIASISSPISSSNQESSVQSLQSSEVHNQTVSSLPFLGKTKLLYFEFEVNTTSRPYYEFHQGLNNRTKQILLSKGFNWTVRPSTYADYLHELSQYQFTIAPPGDGIDNPRTWEALLVGTIPIVLYSPINDLYDDLPVLIVRNYSAINPRGLEQIYKKLQESKSQFKFEKLYAKYWERFVLRQSL